jgi:hypothetical protein
VRVEMKTVRIGAREKGVCRNARPREHTVGRSAKLYLARQSR